MFSVLSQITNTLWPVFKIHDLKLRTYLTYLVKNA